MSGATSRTGAFAVPPAAFEPVKELLGRYQMRICERLHLSPDQTRGLAWWEFDQAISIVDEWLERGGR